MTILLTAVTGGKMKKNLLIISIIVVIVSIFVSCSNNNSNDLNLDKSLSQESGISQADVITESKKTSTENKFNVKNDDIEKVFLSIYGKTSESNYDIDAEKLIEEIKNCQDIPESILVEEIGKISIKNKNSEDIVDVAELYIAADYSVYAVYVDNADNNYAYKIDTSLFE